MAGVPCWSAILDLVLELVLNGAPPLGGRGVKRALNGCGLLQAEASFCAGVSRRCCWEKQASRRQKVSVGEIEASFW